MLCRMLHLLHVCMQSNTNRLPFMTRLQVKIVFALSATYSTLVVFVDEVPDRKASSTETLPNPESLNVQKYQVHTVGQFWLQAQQVCSDLTKFWLGDHLAYTLLLAVTATLTTHFVYQAFIWHDGKARQMSIRNKFPKQCRYRFSVKLHLT